MHCTYHERVRKDDSWVAKIMTRRVRTRFGLMGEITRSTLVRPTLHYHLHRDRSTYVPVSPSPFSPWPFILLARVIGQSRRVNDRRVACRHTSAAARRSEAAREETPASPERSGAAEQQAAGAAGV